VRLGLIGGSGLYAMEAVEDAHWESVSSPFGEPSDQLLFGRIGKTEVVFLPRHGRGHRLSPSAINYRANIDAMKRAGVTDIVSLSACGSFREDLSPGTFILVDQVIDMTRERPRTFFESGLVAHISMAHPVCGCLGRYLTRAGEKADIPLVQGGTYLAIEGPQFSTLAESHLFRGWGADVIGMTKMPEARLAREAEIRYATVAMVTDYDCWREDEDAVQVTDVLSVLKDNAAKAQDLVVALAGEIAVADTPEWAACSRPCHRVLDQALITPPEARGPDALAKLDAVAGRVLGEGE